MTSPTQKGEIKCACVRDDAIDCFRARYAIPFCETAADHGGPCECACHDIEPYDYEDEQP